MAKKLKLPTLEQVQAELSRRSLSTYIKHSWPIIEPGAEYLHNWHIDAIAEHLEAVTAGQIKRLIINIPPRYAKSITVTVMWPTWEWLHHPETRWIFASYSASLSTKHSMDRRTIIMSEWYQRNFDKVFKLANAGSRDQNMLNTKSEFQNDKRGTMFSTSVGGSVTGIGGNRIVIDDPHNPKEAQSDAERRAGITFFDQTLYTRLDDKKKGAIVVVMQRLHESDLTGHLLQQGGWEHLCIPATSEGKTVISLPSGKEIEREDGHILWPEREGKEELEQTKRALGSYAYAGQYQQRPAPSEGGILKRHWWRYWHFPGQKLPPVTVRLPDGEYLNIENIPLPERFDEQIQSWDMAFKDTKTSAYVAGQAWGRVRADCFLLDQIRDKLDFVKTVEAVKTLTAKWPRAHAKLIEDKANGPAVIASLQHDIPGIIAIPAKDSKEARAHAISPFIEAGNVYLPHPQIFNWVDDLIEEAVSFPNGKYKDQVDTLTQALARLSFEGNKVPTDMRPFQLVSGSRWRGR